MWPDGVAPEQKRCPLSTQAPRDLVLRPPARWPDFDLDHVDLSSRAFRRHAIDGAGTGRR